MAAAVCMLRRCGMARARNVPQGYAGFFMATAVCVLRWRGACVRPVRPVRQDGCARLRPDGLRRGKPRYTPRVCCAVVWYGSGEDLPFGWLLLIGAPTATLIILIILIILISAARRV